MFQLTNKQLYLKNLIEKGATHFSCPEVSAPRIIRYMKEHGIAPSEPISGDGWNSLQTASWYGHTELVRMLLATYDNTWPSIIDAKTTGGYNDTALVLAIMNCNVGCVEVLLDRGASIDFVLDKSSLWPDNPERLGLHGKDVYGLIEYVASNIGGGVFGQDDTESTMKRNALYQISTLVDVYKKPI